MKQFSVKLGLDNIANFLNYLGNPQKSLKAFHIAGSNGKGSTASFVASILMEAGYKTGLYTSPHLVRYNERIRINGKMIPDDFLMNFIELHESYIRENEPTFFEITTAIAFEYFRQNNVDYAVIETGLGGRLDATNVLDPIAVIITSISNEHSRILGDSIEKIAAEKAGIIKSSAPVYLGKMTKSAEEVINLKCEEMEAKLFRFTDYFESFVDFGLVDIGNETLHIYDTPLAGMHQVRNAGLAVKAVVGKFPNIKFSDIFEGIKNVIPNSGLQCRYEVYSEKPKIIFDAAHNIEGINSFIETFKKKYANYDRRILVTGMMNDKDIAGMLGKLKPFFTEFYFTAIPNERSETPENVRKTAASLDINGCILEKTSQFIERQKLDKGNSCTVVLGSIYLLGEIKKNLISEKIT